MFKQLRDLPFTLENKEIIVQRYIDKPLLIEGIKFDMRVYVVVLGFNPIQAFLCDEGLARFCTVSDSFDADKSSLLGQVRSANQGEFPQGVHALDQLLDQQDQ